MSKIGLHHYHTRSRKEPYPASRFGLRILDVTVYIAGIVGPLATIPQIVQIYTTHSAAGVSVATWVMYVLFDTPWIAYAVVHKERPLLLCYVLWVLCNALVAVGAIIYG
ncbi:MAG TPA: PQ-loop domain-containing transporter [Candidatus Paceibacterota bacterium]|nr:PQ-loop domain-containing transporter [Candidatus Paceibacterota bacterium]